MSKGKRRLPELKSKTSYWDARPKEIKALRQTLGWNQMELAAFLGVYYLPKARNSCTVSEWECGNRRPRKVYRQHMLRLVDKFKGEYLQCLKSLK